MIRVQGLKHRYQADGEWVLRGLDFEVGEGEIFGFLGPNGAGKSTTQKILTGILSLSEGQAQVAGVDLSHPTRALFQKIGVSFEQPNLYRRLTGLENLEFFTQLYSGPTRNPMELLTRLGLADAAHRKAGQYSKGMQQRLVLARSLLHNPMIWFLDEPTSGLDPATAMEVKSLINEVRDQGTTIFLTTHNMQIAQELCDRVAFLNQGEIAACDTPHNLRLRYSQGLLRVGLKGGQVHEISLGLDPDRQRLNTWVEGGEIETIHSQEASLDEVFVRLTGRRLHHAQEA